MRIVSLAAATLAVSAVAGAFGVAGAAEDGPVLPGYWESTSTVSFPVASTKTERKCFSAKVINAYLTGPVNNHYSCHYDSRSLHAGHARLAGECVDNNGFHSKVQVEGTYAPEQLHLNAQLQVKLGGLQIPISTAIDAHRLNAQCPAGMKVEGEDKKDDGGKDGASDAPKPGEG